MVSIASAAFPESVADVPFLAYHRAWQAGFIVAEDEGDIAGFIMLRARRFRCAFIVLGAVRSDRRRRGIYTALLNASIHVSAARGLDTMAADVRPSNAEAIRTYRRAGFRIVARIPKAYPDGEAAYRVVRGSAIPFWLDTFVRLAVSPMPERCRAGLRAVRIWLGKASL